MDVFSIVKRNNSVVDIENFDQFEKDAVIQSRFSVKKMQ